jgi:DNA-binding XRE family transcriptional regulator
MTMSVLEAIAERSLGADVLRDYPELRLALQRAEEAFRRGTVSQDEKLRISHLVDLCSEYRRESDPDEQENILRTIFEISKNEPLEMPRQTLDDWEAELRGTNLNFAKANRTVNRRVQRFLKKYFSLRAKAGLHTQAAVAKATGLSRGYVAVIETGEHFPQQKTLQKLSKAFAVDVTDLLP